MNRKLMFAMLVALLLLPSLPAEAIGCAYTCKTGLDEKGHAFAHCWEWLNGTRGNMASCQEVQNCWPYLGGTYCDEPTCTGLMCYEV